MAEERLSASLQLLFDRLASGEVLNFIRRQKLSGVLLDRLKMILLIVHAVLNDAEVKQFTDREIKQWVIQLKDAVYHVEDLLDEIATEALQWKVEAVDSQTGPSQVWNSFSSWVKAPFSVQSVESRVKEMIGRLEIIAEAIDELGLKKGDGEKLSPRSPSTCLIDESCVYGRDEIKEEIIIKQLLVDNCGGNKIDVISIVGKGGAGKTTLAQLLYNDERVKEHFNVKAWVCVSTEFLLVRVTKLILEEICFTCHFDCENPNELQLHLKERIGNQKFLLVLDGVRDSIRNHDWDGLRTPLLAAARGSKIVVTTRTENVARIMNSVQTYNLGGLCPEDCWSLFTKLAFENGDSTSYPQLESLGRKIVNKCQGLPLAVKALGSLLRSKAKEREWDDILSSEIWALQPNDKILPALILSYHHLTLHLKRCFAYCSIFPKDYEFNKEKLILLWMAEGLLQLPQSNKRMEEVGHLYFNELVAKSFFQKSITKESCFVMHDLSHDMTQYISGEFCIRLGDDKVQKISEQVHHLLDFKSDYGCAIAFNRFEAIAKAKYLRTFFELRPLTHRSWYILTKCALQDVLPKFRFLRVLSFYKCQMIELPDSVGNLRHLRYLDLSHTMIRKLPESICCLYNLQTIILSGCEQLIELPSRMGKLVNLRYLDITNAYALRDMPSDIGQLKCLQKLTDFIVGPKNGLRIGELRELSDIRGKLQISKMENVVCVEDALQANMEDKSYLDELVLKWDHGISDAIMKNGATNLILGKLRPHSNLGQLGIIMYPGAVFPDWVGDPSFLNLVSVKLSHCENCSWMPPLGQLPSLKHLCISGMKGVESVGCELNGNGVSSVRPSFKSLKTLKFYFMYNWQKWLYCGHRRGEFPCLQELHLWYCPKLTGKLPKQLRSLKKLEIVGCQNLLAATFAVPAICTLRMRNYGRLHLKKPACGFVALQTSEFEISNCSQWKQLPVGPQVLSITKFCSVESLLEEGIPQTNTCFLDYCCFSRSLRNAILPTTLKSLEISNCTKLEFLLPEFLKCHHPFLQQLRICGGRCDVPLSLSFSFSIFPKLTLLQIEGVEGIEFLSAFTSERDITSFDSLHIGGCPDLVYIELPALSSAGYYISKCVKLKLLKHSLSSLQRLSLQDCPELLFQRDGLPSNLCQLEIVNCSQLIPQVEWGLQRMASLTEFRFSGGCKDMKSFPQESMLPSTLFSLQIEHLSNLKSLDSKGLQQLTSLTKLSIINCPKLQSLTGRVLQHVPYLEELHIYECPGLQTLSGSGLHHLIFLKILVIFDCPRLQSLTEEGLQGLASLRKLYIGRCTELQSLTEVGLQHLFSLEELLIFHCHKLQYLTKQSLPKSLSYLEVNYCPLLEKQYHLAKGKDWLYIAHIPQILINGVLV